MDPHTLAAYDAHAQAFADDWNDQPAPSRGAHQRDGHTRLYAAFDKRVVLEALPGSDILLDEAATSASSGKTIHRIVARKHAHD